MVIHTYIFRRGKKEDSNFDAILYYISSRIFELHSEKKVERKKNKWKKKEVKKMREISLGRRKNIGWEYLK